MAQQALRQSGHERLGRDLPGRRASTDRELIQGGRPRSVAITEARLEELKRTRLAMHRESEGMRGSAFAHVDNHPGDLGTETHEEELDEPGRDRRAGHCGARDAGRSAGGRLYPYARRWRWTGRGLRDRGVGFERRGAAIAAGPHLDNRKRLGAREDASDHRRGQTAIGVMLVSGSPSERKCSSSAT